MVVTKPTEHISSDMEETALAMEARLDAALADTFPASDPVAITVSAPRIAGSPR